MLAALFVGTLTVISYLRAQNKLKIHTFFLILLTIILIDTWRIDKMFLNYVNPNRVLPEERVNADAVAFLKRDNSLFRVLALPDHNQMPLPGIDLVTGFHDFAIRRYDNILKSDALYNPVILNLLNTKYIVAPSEMDAPYIQKIAGRQGLHIYRNPGALPWFYLVPQYEIIPDENQILQKLGDPTTNPMQTAIVEKKPRHHPPTPPVKRAALNASNTTNTRAISNSKHQPLAPASSSSRKTTTPTGTPPSTANPNPSFAPTTSGPQ